MKKKVFFATTALGFSAVITQLLIVREFLNVFYGNELIIGLILANWLLLTGLGSCLGRYSENIKDKQKVLALLQTILSLLPVASLFAVGFVKSKIFFPGELVSPVSVFASSFLILLPFCLISGFLITLACSASYFRKIPEQIGLVYFWESVGSIIGGLAFSFLLVFFLSPFQTALVLLVVNLLSAFLMSKSAITKASVIFLALACITVFFSINPDRLSTSALYPGQEVVEQVNSKYGRLTVTRSMDQLNFFENGMMLFSTDSVINDEETVHYAMSQYERPKKVLLISGGASGITKEVLKYDIGTIDYVELDPKIVELGRKYTTNLDSVRIRAINSDGRRFVKQTEEQYDVVLISLPDPSTAQINRFYTLEFFQELKGRMSPNGVVSLRISSSENYLSEEAKRFNSVVYNTLREVFKNVLIIPGDDNFYISSDKMLSYDIANLLKAKNIETEYVNQDFIKGKITKDRIDYAKGFIDVKEGVNKDFSPVAYYYHLLFWKEKFKTNILPAVLILAIIVAVFVLKSKPLTVSISVVGFSVMSLELIIMLGFQIIYGYVYSMLSLIITLFMIGLAAGAYYSNNKLKDKSFETFVKNQLFIAGYATALPFILISMSYLKDEALVFLSSTILIPLLVIVLGFMAGFAFPLASKLSFDTVEKTSAKVYAADLIGSCLGAIIISVVLIPLLGITQVCMIIACLNIAASWMMWKKV
ncbi:hypothetical protein FJZ53_01995 [Candidatus Woesearchaeota archaeon]|nr:hypothetical protein [Candidatus Woesearchaeota archaeon]